MEDITELKFPVSFANFCGMSVLVFDCLEDLGMNGRPLEICRFYRCILEGKVCHCPLKSPKWFMQFSGSDFPFSIFRNPNRHLSPNAMVLSGISPILGSVT